MKNLTLNNIANAVLGTLFCQEDALKNTEVTDVVIDSRKVSEGALFFAVKGERVDGHDFIEDVFEKGAICVISEKSLEIDKPYILVKSSLQALKDLAEFYRTQLSIQIVGITGSVGKTSTKEMIASVLSQKYHVLKTQGNFNNEIGVPLTLFQIRKEHEVAVVEMGISDFGEMHRLSKMVKPNICVITNIGICHLENLKDRDGVLKAKTEIFDFAADDCTVILNGDDDKLQTVTSVHDKKPVFYGFNENLSIYAKDMVTKGVYGMDATICAEGKSFDVSFSLPGKHMVANAMAGAAVGLVFGMSVEDIQKGINEIKSVGGRLNILERNGYTIVDDCYNANPVSVKSSLDVLANADGRKVAILGDMFELGAKEKELHYQVGAYLGEKKIDLAIFVGALSENTYLGLKDSKASTESYYYETLEDLFMFLDLMIKQDDTILVKASHSMHFEEIVQKLQQER